MSLEAALELIENAPKTAPVLVLTGAGISAESGIPTFRGPEGYWQIGSRNYHPQELATHAAFLRMPKEVWAWYLHRHTICSAAAPNAAHEALVDLERRLGERFMLVTQNVDGLHERAGAKRLYEIHGNIAWRRCSEACSEARLPIPSSLLPFGRGEELSADGAALLHCERCGAFTRPHVLWFDEYYDEALFRAESALGAAARAGLLLVVGTSGATNLPTQIVLSCLARQVPTIVVDPELTPFAEAAERVPHGVFLRGAAATIVPRLTQAL